MLACHGSMAVESGQPVDPVKLFRLMSETDGLLELP
jgi:hypothetical protein